VNEAEFKKRTKQFGLRVVKLCDALPSKRSADVIGKQLLRSGLSVGSNYRAACRAKSRKDMIAKLAIVEEEADESIHWLEMVVDTGLMDKSDLEALTDEGNQIVKMIVASIKTLRHKPGDQP
jgi:four helix bundle protein